AFGPRTHDMDRTRIGPQLFAHGAEVDERGHQPALRLGRPQQGPRAIARGQHDGRLLAGGSGVLARRVAAVEAGQRYAAALATDDDSARGAEGRGPLLRLL